MKDDDLFYLCGVIAGLSGVPVRVYRDSEQIYFSSVEVGRAPCRGRV